MKEKTKKTLKGVGLSLGAVALLAVGVGVGACSVKYGLTQPTTTTPIRKSLIQSPKKAENDSVLGTWQPKTDVSISVPIALYNTSFEADYLYNGLQYNSIVCNEMSSGGGGDFQSVLKTPSGRPKFANGGAHIHIYYTGDNSLSTFAYDNYSGWTAEGGITILSIVNVTNQSLFSTFLNTFYTKSTPIIPEPDPEPNPLPQIKEKIVLNASYDFRRWFGNVDPTTGLIQYSLGSGVSLVNIRVGGLEWVNLGNNRVYNVIEFSLQPLQSANAFLVSDNLAKTASSLYGDNLNQFAMVSNVYYSYQSGYDGAYTVLTDAQLPSVDYRDKVYTYPLVTAQLDGTNNNVNAIDVRNCVIPSIYRTFGISEDKEVVFSTNGYSSVTLRQLLGMDFSSVVNYSDGTASAFSLLTQAFGSVAGLLAVQVLPNITLGLLLFLPLIASVIVLIIKAVKK